jgi:hypothetical protein
MANHRDAAPNKERDGIRHAFAGFRLDCLAARFLHHPDGRFVGLLGASLIAAEGEVDDDERAVCAATARPCMIIMSRVTPTRARQAMHDHADGVTDQNQIDARVEKGPSPHCMPSGKQSFPCPCEQRSREPSSGATACWDMLSSASGALDRGSGHIIAMWQQTSMPPSRGGDHAELGTIVEWVAHRLEEEDRHPHRRSVGPGWLRGHALAETDIHW